MPQPCTFQHCHDAAHCLALHCLCSNRITSSTRQMQHAVHASHADAVTAPSCHLLLASSSEQHGSVACAFGMLLVGTVLQAWAAHLAVKGSRMALEQRHLLHRAVLLKQLSRLGVCGRARNASYEQLQSSSRLTSDHMLIRISQVYIFGVFANAHSTVDISTAVLSQPSTQNASRLTACIGAAAARWDMLLSCHHVMPRQPDISDHVCCQLTCVLSVSMLAAGAISSALRLPPGLKLGSGHLTANDV